MNLGYQYCLAPGAQTRAFAGLQFQAWSGATQDSKPREQQSLRAARSPLPVLGAEALDAFQETRQSR